MDKLKKMDNIITCILLFLATFTLASCSIYNAIHSKDFEDVKASQEIVVISFIRSKPYDAVFQSNFREAGSYLDDFGVHFGTVDCLSDPVDEYCSKAEASKNVFIFRNGRFFVTLSYDSLFGVDAIVANILHLVLLVDVPIIGEHADLQAKMESNAGRQDIVLGYIPAVGLKADRAFMEVAFAYRHKYAFLMTTNGELVDDQGSRSPSSVQMPKPLVFVLQCKETERGHPCPRAKYFGPATTEGLALMMKTLQLPPVVDLSKPGQTSPFKEQGVSALYAIADPSYHEQTMSIVMDTKNEFIGNLGFVVVDRDDVILAELDLLPSTSSECNPACFVLRGHEQDKLSDSIHDAAGLKAFILSNSYLVFSHLGNLDEKDDVVLEENSEGRDAVLASDGDEMPEQERQDDSVQEATIPLRNVPRAKDSPVSLLTDLTFSQFTGQHQLTGVLFTMRWNPRSLAFLQSFEAAAQSLISMFAKDQENSPLAQVECSSWPDVCDKSNVTVYPTVKMYREKIDVATYGGILDEQNFLRSYLLHDLPNSLEIQSAKDLDAFTKGQFPAPWVKEHIDSGVLAVIPDQYKEEKSTFLQIAENLQGKYLFGLCSSGCIEQMQEATKMQPSVTIYKWSEQHDPKQTFEGDFSMRDVLAFIKEGSLPVLPELTAATMPTYLARRRPFVILFNAGDAISKKAAASLREIAKDNVVDRFVLCQMDSSADDAMGSQTLSTYGFLPLLEQSTIVILDHSAGEVCRFPEGKAKDPSATSIKKWLQTPHKERVCSESRALIDREWKPLVPPYDYLKLMDEAEHQKPSGRTGLRVHKQEEEVNDNDNDDDDEGNEEDKDEEMEEGEREGGSHKHVEL